jgi:predicted RecA/RadA family phage recombinase
VDERAEGSIAYTTVPSNGPVCVAVVGAAGGERPRQLGCDPGYIGSVRWDDDGLVRVAVQTDEGGEQVDVISDGAMLFPRVQDGRAEVVAALPDGTEQVVMTADGAREFRTATWSPDGAWAAAVDGEGRLMVAPIADGDARLLARDVIEPAWHQARRDP